MRATEKDRETCLCKLHENPRYKIKRLYAEKVISTNNVDTLLECINCNVNNQQCMYRECSSCKEKTVPTNYVSGKVVEWFSWKTKRVTREKIQNGETIHSKVTMTVKETETGTIETLVNDLQSELERLCRHIFNIKTHYKSLKALTEKLTNEEAWFHIDFSENYCCKYSSEIQSTHFGASKQQISIYTGVVYTKENTIPFATVSDSAWP